MAGRAKTDPPTPPWGGGCEAETWGGGVDAMRATREGLKPAIAEADAAANKPIGQRGRVYISGWRINTMRDLSEANAWLLNTWGTATAATADETAIGLI